MNFHLPLVNRIREAGRHLVLFVLGISFLSGLGYSLLGQNLELYKERRNPRQLIVPSLMVTAFAVVILWELLPKKLIGPELFLRGSGGPWVIALSPLLFMLGRVFRFPSSAKIASAAAFVSAAALVIPIRGIPASFSDFNKPINLLSHRIIRGFADGIDARDYRVDFRDSAFDRKFWAMNASYYGIKSFYNQLTPQPYAQFRFMLAANVPRMRAMMGARYVLCGPAFSPTDAGAKQILEIEGYRLYENAKPMGRLTLVHQVAGFDNGESEFIKIITKGFDYFSTAYVTAVELEAVTRFLGTSPRLARARDRIVKIVDQPNRSHSTVVSASPSLLVLNEWFTPAWKVRVNGKKQPVLRINQWQTGVLLRAGKNRVEFQYRPTLFRALMVSNRITILLLLLFVAFEVLLRRRLGIVRFQPA